MEATYQGRRLSATAERQMRTWSTLEEIGSRLAAGQPIQPSHQPLRYVTISREVGAGGTTVGQLVGKGLGWDVYDSNLLDAVAERHKESRLLLDLVDEAKSNWVVEILGNWTGQGLISHSKYAKQMRGMIRLLAHAGPSVFVGRGAQFILPRSELLAVRLVASESFRLNHTMHHLGIDRSAAQRVIHDKERGRKESIAHDFQRDVDDPHHYDLMLNIEHLGHQLAAAIIVAAVHDKKMLAPETVVR